MSRLSEEAQRLLQMAAGSDAPDGDAAARVWSALEPRLGQPPSLPVEDSAPVLTEPAAGTAWQWAAGTAVTTLAAMGALIVWGTTEPTEPEQASGDAPRPPVVRHEARAEKLGKLDPVEPPKRVLPEKKTPPVGATPTRDEASQPPSRRPGPSAKAQAGAASGARGTRPDASDDASDVSVERAEPAEPSKDSAETASSSLLEEARLMKGVQAALKRQAWDVAAAGLDRHADRFPQGALIEERDAARVLVACGRKEPGAKAAAQAFRATYPASVHNERIADACRRE